MSMKYIPEITCDICNRTELNPPETWKTFDIALHSVSWRPVVNICDACTSMSIGSLIGALEAKYGDKQNANS